MKRYLSLIFAVAFVLSLTACGSSTEGPSQQEGYYDPLATCLTDSGAVFLGAYWCPVCDDQKEKFGDSVDLIPYVECDPKGENSQAQFCLDQKINGYPTWIFVDGTRLEGSIPLEQLAEVSGCPLSMDDQSVLFQSDEETED